MKFKDVFVFDNVELAWAELHKKNKYTDKYQVKLVNLSDAQVAKLNSLGVDTYSDPVKKPDQGTYIVCKSQYPIRAFDNDGEEYAPEVLVANGSKAKVKLGAYPWRLDPSKASTSVIRLQITDLIEYKSAENAEDDLEIL